MPTEADSLALARRQTGNELFRQPVSFVLSVAKLSQLPLTDLPEVAFAAASLPIKKRNHESDRRRNQ